MKIEKWMERSGGHFERGKSLIPGTKWRGFLEYKKKVLDEGD